MPLEQIAALVATPTGLVAIFLYVVYKMLEWTSSRLDEKDRYIRETLMQEIRNSSTVIRENSEVLRLVSHQLSKGN